MVLLRIGWCAVADYHYGDRAGGEEKEETEEEKIKKEIKNHFYLSHQWCAILIVSLKAQKEQIPVYIFIFTEICSFFLLFSLFYAQIKFLSLSFQSHVPQPG